MLSLLAEMRQDISVAWGYGRRNTGVVSFRGCPGYEGAGRGVGRLVPRESRVARCPHDVDIGNLRRQLFQNAKGNGRDAPCLIVPASVLRICQDSQVFLVGVGGQSDCNFFCGCDVVGRGGSCGNEAPLGVDDRRRMGPAREVGRGIRISSIGP